MSKVLVVEDDATIGQTIVLGLSARGFQVLYAKTGEQALSLCENEHPDAILLDLGLPDIDGLHIITRLRQWSQVPILVVSARYESQGKVTALDLGADDYVTKPFAMDELLARLRAALRRATPHEEEKATITTKDGRLVIDLSHQSVTKDGQKVKLTPTEWRILTCFARNIDRLIPSQEILKEVWGPEFSGESSYLRVYLSNLRHKLEPDSSSPQYFHTELGMGYRFTP